MVEGEGKVLQGDWRRGRTPITAQMPIIEGGVCKGCRGEGVEGCGKDPVTAHMLITIQYKELLGRYYASLLPVNELFPAYTAYTNLHTHMHTLLCSKCFHRVQLNS